MAKTLRKLIVATYNNQKGSVADDEKKHLQCNFLYYLYCSRNFADIICDALYFNLQQAPRVIIHSVYFSSAIHRHIKKTLCLFADSVDDIWYRRIYIAEA